MEGEKILATLRFSKSKGKGDAAAAKKEAKATKIKIEAAGTNATVGNKTAKGVLDLDSLSFVQVLVSSLSIPPTPSNVTSGRTFDE